MRILRILMTALFCAGAIAVSATASEHPAADPAAPPLPWQVLDGRTGTSVPFEDWITMLAEQDVVYLGEEHRNRWHIEAAIKIATALLARNRPPALALEMFGWDGQAGLNRYLSGSQSIRDVFLQESRWEQNWGGPYEEYEPLVAFAQEHGLPVLALNPPLPLVRLVARQGLAVARQADVMARWRMQDETFEENPAYRETIVKQLRLCHGGLPEEAYARMYDASLFRDEGMAKTISAWLQTGRPTPVLSYTGGGHIQYRLPVPNRVARRVGETRPPKQATIYLAAINPAEPDHSRELWRESIADYIWLTPLSAQGAPRRCG